MSMPETLTDSTQMVLQARFTLQNRLRSGTSWFFWIAGLSLINTLATLFGVSWNFAIGLGITQVIDIVAMTLVSKLHGPGVLIVDGIAIVMDLGLAAMFVAFGWLARRNHAWVFILGMVIYALDGLLFVLFQSWLSVGLHAFALFGLYQGLQALYALRKLPTV